MSLALGLMAFVGSAPASTVVARVDPGVPDQGRAWELVTPADPMSASVVRSDAISVAGDRVAYETEGVPPDAASGGPFPSVSMATRGSSGWTDASVAIPYPKLDGFPGLGNLKYGGPQAFNADLSTWLGIRHLPLQPGQSEYDVGLFRWGPVGPATLLANIGPNASYVGASADEDRVFFTSEEHLLSADAARTSNQSIYEISGSSIRLVDVDNGGALLSDCGSSVAQMWFEPANRAIVRKQVVSRDGRRIFFSTYPSCMGSAQVFLRENATTTTEISASQCDLPDCGPESNVVFAEATPDGSAAFLYTEEKLTDEDTNSAPDFYRYDVASGELKLLTGDWPGFAAGASARLGTIETTSDGSKLYFAAEMPGDPPTTHLLLAEASGARELAGAYVNPGDYAGELQATADGRYVVFMSRAQLVAGDTDESIDVYRYDSEDDSFTELSTGPSGGNGPFDAKIESDYLNEKVSSRPYRSISKDGSRVFFTTADQLVPQDHNEAVDVYEWANGDVGLISSGTGSHNSEYVGATADGGTVFIRTPQTLLGSDRDGGDVDIYAARIGGGFPEPPSPGPGECEGAACGSRAHAELDRSTPPSAGSGPARIELRRLDAAALRRIVASGRIELLAEVPQRGRLTATALGRLGGRWQTIADAATTAVGAGSVNIGLRLSKASRHELAQGKSLKVRVRLRLSGLGSSEEVRFALKGAK